MSRTMEWTVRVDLSDEDGATKAAAVLDTGTAKLTGHGVAHCSLQDPDVPTIGDELAASRAMRDVAAQLMSVADRELGEAGAGSADGPVPPPYAWSDATT
ncbi:dsRBD fold-containing protein [Streptomyces brevispora]|uniref:dsRBD fold-containing protein n=1 Tax=Streptomyces brevispora TaxID=887462 RepID=UPI00371F55F6